MNTERILQVADAIAAQPRKFAISRFYLKWWGGPSIPPKCSTAACVAGWTVWVAGVEQLTDKNVNGEARRYLEIGIKQADELFFPIGYTRGRDNLGEPYTAARAVAVLRHFAKSGVVDWLGFNAVGLPVNA